MKLCKVINDTVAIPIMPKVTWFKNGSPDTVVYVQKRFVHLHCREYEGRMIMAAYDRETDTLFVKDD